MLLYILYLFTGVKYLDAIFDIEIGRDNVNLTFTKLDPNKTLIIEPLSITVELNKLCKNIDLSPNQYVFYKVDNWHLFVCFPDAVKHQKISIEIAHKPFGKCNLPADIIGMPNSEPNTIRF